MNQALGYYKSWWRKRTLLIGVIGLVFIALLVAAACGDDEEAPTAEPSITDTTTDESGTAGALRHSVKAEE